jgi:hypothetical protein
MPVLIPRMKRTPHKLSAVLSGGHAKAILRGGTFHRVQVLLQEGQTYIEHCGLNYKVTRQKDAMGRIICTWSKS